MTIRGAIARSIVTVGTIVEEIVIIRPSDTTLWSSNGSDFACQTSQTPRCTTEKTGQARAHGRKRAACALEFLGRNQLLAAVSGPGSPSWSRCWRTPPGPCTRRTRRVSLPVTCTGFPRGSHACHFRLSDHIIHIINLRRAFRWLLRDRLIKHLIMKKSWPQFHGTRTLTKL